jgi:hypothetical protein
MSMVYKGLQLCLTLKNVLVVSFAPLRQMTTL